MPRTYTVTRNVMIQAAPERVFELLADFHHWVDWSPWEDLDPQMTRTYTGPDRGTGAGYTWSGNRKAGAGSMTIRDMHEPTSVDIDVVFEKPFASSSQVTFTIQPQTAGAEVAWTMRGEQRGLMALMGRVLSMDKLIGKDFEKGLSRLKALAERP